MESRAEQTPGGIRRRRGAVAAGLALGLVAGAACTPPPTIVDGEPPRPECNPLSIETCILPFPSDHFTVADPTSATGLRPSVDRSAVGDGVFESLPPSFQPETFFARADGYSPVGVVSFETSHAIDEAALLATPDRYVSAVDGGTGAEIPVLVDVPSDGDGRLIQVWPRARWPFATRVTVSISAALPSASGSPLLRPVGWTEAAIAPTAFSAAETLTSTTFTVRSESDVRDDVEAMAATAWAADHPVRNVEATASPLPHIRAIIQGEVRLTDFRTADGEIDLGAPGNPVAPWVAFEIFYPETPAAGGSAPVVLYGHGIGVAKQTAVLMAGANAARGWATVAIDQPNHGTRAEAEGGLRDLIAPEHLGRVTSMVTQSSIDFVSLQRALRTTMADIDVVRADGLFLTSAQPDGIPDLDPTGMIYQGTSMGGVLGATYLSITPRPLPAAMLQVPGVGISHILTNSILWNAVLDFERIVPEAATPGEASALISAAQMAIDRGDASNWVERAAARGTELFVDYGIGDGIVPNEATERLLEIAGIPLMAPIVEPVPHLEQRAAAASPAAGSLSWATQIAVSAPIPQLIGPLGHLAFIQPAAAESQARWLDAVDDMFSR